MVPDTDRRSTLAPWAAVRSVPAQLGAHIGFRRAVPGQALEPEALWEALAQRLNPQLAARVLALAPWGLRGRAVSREFGLAVTEVLREHPGAARALVRSRDGLGITQHWELLRGHHSSMSQVLVLRSRASDTALFLLEQGTTQLYHLRHLGVWHSDYFFLSYGVHLPQRTRHWFHLNATKEAELWLHTFRPGTACFKLWPKLRWWLTAPLRQLSLEPEAIKLPASFGCWHARAELSTKGAGIIFRSTAAKVILQATGLSIIPSAQGLRRGGLCIPEGAPIRALDAEACRAWHQ